MEIHCYLHDTNPNGESIYYIIIVGEFYRTLFRGTVSGKSQLAALRKVLDYLENPPEVQSNSPIVNIP